MVIPTFAGCMLISQHLTVLDQDTGTLRPFRFNREQKRILKKALRTRRLVILKGRQIGCSTVVVFLMMVVALCNPGLPCAIVADDSDKAKGILRRARDWLVEMGVRLTVDAKESIELENGAVIEAKSAISPGEDGESKVGRSKPYGFIMATEMAFWRNAPAVWASLTSTMLVTAMIVVESTGTPGDTRFKKIYDDAPTTGWERMFLGVEEHAAYRAAPDGIDDDTFAMLRTAYGFKRRDSAAWWWAHLSVVKKGDTSRMLREYPVLDAHAWTLREGLHITKFTAAIVRVDGPWNFYAEPTNVDGVDVFDEPVVMGVDTSAGVGLDASALGGIGHRTGKLLFTWKNNTTPLPKWIPFVRASITRFRPVATVIEGNGLGKNVFQTLDGVAGVEEQTSGKTDGEVQKRRDAFRDDVESGALPIGGDLIGEAKSAQVKAVMRPDGTVRIVFVGMDDVINAASFARKWREANPYTPPPTPADRTRFFVTNKLKNAGQTQTW